MHLVTSLHIYKFFAGYSLARRCGIGLTVTSCLWRRTISSSMPVCVLLSHYSLHAFYSLFRYSTSSAFYDSLRQTTRILERGRRNNLRDSARSWHALETGNRSTSWPITHAKVLIHLLFGFGHGHIFFRPICTLRQRNFHKQSWSRLRTWNEHKNLLTIDKKTMHSWSFEC